jgi:hypothetical protein
MRDSTAETSFYFEAPLSILGYREEGEWVALALELDLRGYGAGWDEALSEVRDLVQMQISFAYEKGQPDMIWRDAEPEYWERFRQAQRAGVVAIAGHTASPQPEIHAGVLKVSCPQVAEANEARFVPANG